LIPNPVYFSHPTTGDLDLDGDLDMLIGETGGNFRYIQNLANANAPLFDGGQLNPYGITGGVATVVLPEFVDIDGDGDLDILATSDGGALWFYENLQLNLNVQEIENHVIVGPNPFQNIISITSTFQLEEIRLLDFQGQLIWQEFKPKSTVQFGSLSNGMYILEIRDENNTIHRKKIEKR
jgi:hypothetical protein